jgi:DNA-binding NarL/FixJ family response regulator
MNILIADDHPTINEVFQTLFNAALHNEPNTFAVGHCCKTTFYRIQEASAKNHFFDVALLDYRMPGYPEQQLFSGVDIALHIKKIMPKCKIIMMTAAMDLVTVFDIIQILNPEAFFYKSDFRPDDLLPILKEVFAGNKYRSEDIVKNYQKGWETSILIDSINRKILSYLALGFKIKEISAEMGLSESAIHKRISKMKEDLQVSDSSGLLKEVKKRAYV